MSTEVPYEIVRGDYQYSDVVSLGHLTVSPWNDG